MDDAKRGATAKLFSVNFQPIGFLPVARDHDGDVRIGDYSTAFSLWLSPEQAAELAAALIRAAMQPIEKPAEVQLLKVAGLPAVTDEVLL